MRFFLSGSLLLTTVVGTAVPRASDKVDYTGFKVLRLPLPDTKQNIEPQIEELSAHILNPGKTAIDVVVSPDNLDAITALVPNADVINEDFGAALAAEGELVSISAVPDETWFTAYHPYADHLTFLTDLQGLLPSQSEIFTAGTSVEGRALTGIHIWGSGGKGSKPAVLIHGTVHAREWITTMTTEYFVWQMITQYALDATVKSLVDKYDYYIIPTVNPDGFVYSQTTDRLWRKNRQTVDSSTCVGRDINRNWPFKWEVEGGASTDPCSEIYKGLAPSDSPENQGIVAQVNSLRDGQGIQLYIDVHSYGQHILWPYGYDCSVFAENSDQHLSIATSAADAIEAVSGTTYTIGPSCSTLYATTGSSADYVYAEGNSTYAYMWELRDTGDLGFVLPPEQIQPTATESWAGLVDTLTNIG